VLVDSQFGICRASAASPLTEGERIKVRGSDKSINRVEISLTLPLSLAKGEANQQGLTDNRPTLPISFSDGSFLLTSL
jgi:hypothetical protein